MLACEMGTRTSKVTDTGILQNVIVIERRDISLTDKALSDAGQGNSCPNPDSYGGIVGDTVYSREPLRGR
jgi:hypothetical protein